MLFYSKTILNYKKLWILKNTYPVRKFPDANNLTVMDFENFDAKNSLFSIFFKLSQMLCNDVETVPMYFVTIKATPTTSELIPGSFEKTFSHRMFDLRNPCLFMKLTKLFNIRFYEGFQNLKFFSDENYGLHSVCREDFVSNDFLLKK